MSTLPEFAIRSSLPEGWVPEGTGVWVLVHRDHEDEPWEAIVPEFKIASQGPTPDEALRSAAELLDDYLVLCAREGRTFQEARRTPSVRMTVGFVSHAFSAWARSVLRTHRPLPTGPRRHRLLRLPLDHGLFAL